MTPLTAGRTATLATLLLAGIPAAPVGAQIAEEVLVPAGRLRLEVAPSYHLWDRRFGLRDEGGALVEESEPLGFDLEHEPLLALGDLETRLRAALASPELQLVLGTARARVSRERNTVTIGAALGIFDWLTIGVDVPLVETRTEIAFDFRALDDANLGVSPALLGDGSVQGFRAGLAGSVAALDARRSEACPAGPGCAGLTDLVARYGTFADELGRAYDAPVFVASGSAAAIALAERLSAFRTEADALAPGVPFPGAVPLASGVLDEEQLLELLTATPSGPQSVAPLRTNGAPAHLGDVELTAALRLLEGAVRDSATAPARVRYLLGARALVRLPTGTIDDPDVPLDLGRADAQLDVEVGVFADLRWRRLGIQAEARRGFAQGTTLVRRVAPPERVLAPSNTRRTVRWIPADYLAFEAAPRWHLTDEFALEALFRRFSKDADEYEEVEPTAPGLDPADVLERETQATLTEAGIGLGFSTVTSWREGRARLPFEMRVAVRRSVAGSGGATPDGLRLEASGRVFIRLWGPSPESAP